MFFIFNNYPAVRTGLVIPPFSVFFFFLLRWSLSPDFRSAKQYLPVIFARLAIIRQNFHERWCRKSLAIEWHKNPFDEGKKEYANELWKPPIQFCNYHHHHYHHYHHHHHHCRRRCRRRHPRRHHQHHHHNLELI